MANGKKRALISVHDKTGIVDLARELIARGYDIVSSGGTYKALIAAGVKVVSVEDVTGFPEMLDGRVKTLHPKIHAGILARGTEEHMAQMAGQGIGTFDIVVVNLYPFEEAVSDNAVPIEVAVENIDIGGPSMIRSAAKNHERVAVVVSPDQYPLVLSELRERGALSAETRRRLAVEAFECTATYEAAIFAFLHGRFLPNERFPRTLVPVFRKVEEMRYGENPHQGGAFYREARLTEPSVTSAKVLHGKQLSYNNILDANDALELVKDFERPTVTAVKHTNPCGVASADTIEEAFRRAMEVDPLSAYGGVLALNRPFSLPIADGLKKVFLEIIIAPSYDPAALEQMRKKKNLRILEVGELGRKDASGRELRSVVGGLLVQDRNLKRLDPSMCQVVSKRAPTPEEMASLEFGYRVVKHVKSNSIVLAKGEVTVGIGAGQMSRVDAVKLAVMKSHGKSAGSAMVSDAFFPFRDGIDEAAKGGVTAVAHPGGSIRDQDSIDAANEHGMAMIFTGLREFKH
ncbi:MAG: bifunctional phosphoribosylaminoimidazolecarboxamide formyltransferase/IMP cyclohydrolase [Euryarchaeota archaeon]|nr:bifunctional phosphoribosylaminoimidazolecarboxamide formyltransferase/IMP cyclohydrolase [Euryarchaeota archaeon]